MRIRNRSLVIMLSQGLTQATTLVLGVVLVRVISQDMLGTYRQVFLAYALLGSLLSLQLEQSLYYFIPRAGIDGRRAIVGQTLLLTFIQAAIGGAVMFFGAGIIARFMNNDELAPLIRAFSLFPVFEHVVLLLPSYMISLDRAKRAGMYTLANAATRMAIVITAFALGCKLLTVIWLVVAGAAVLAAVGCVDMIRLSGGGHWKFRWSSVVEQFNYCWPLVATSLTGRLNRQLGNLLIAAMFSPAMYAIYSCGALELPVIALITSSVGAALMPNLVSLTSENKLTQAVSLWQEGARKCSLVLFPCFALCLAVSQDLMIFLYTEDFALAAGPFAVYLFVLPIRIAVFGSLLKAVGSTRAIAVGAALSLVVNAVIGGGLVLLGGTSYVGFIGPAIGSVAGTAATAAFLLWRLEKVMGIPMSKLMRWRELGQTMAVCLVAGLAVYLTPLPVMPLFVKLCVQSVIFMAVLALLAAWFRVLHADEMILLTAPVRMIQRMVRPQPSR